MKYFRRFKTARFLFCLVFATLLRCGVVQADTPQADAVQTGIVQHEIDRPKDSKVIAATALVFGNIRRKDGKSNIPDVVRVPATVVSTIDTVIFSFKPPSLEIPDGAWFYFQYRLLDASSHFTGVLPLHHSNAEAPAEVTYADPICEAGDSPSAWSLLADLEEKDLAALVDIRRRKRDLLLQQLADLLTPEKLLELTAREARHGFSRSEAISAAVPIRPLTQRLGLMDGLEHAP